MVGVEWGLEQVDDGDTSSGGASQVKKLMAPPLPDRPLESDNGRLQGLKTQEMEAKKLSDDTDHVGKPAEFARERDFLVMLPDLATCDPNDPRNANLFRLSEMLLPSQKSKDLFRTLEREMVAVFRVPGTNTVFPNHYALEQPRRHQVRKRHSASTSCTLYTLAHTHTHTHTQTLRALRNSKRPASRQNENDCCSH